MRQPTSSLQSWLVSLLVLGGAACGGLLSRRPPDFVALLFMAVLSAFVFWFLARAMDENKAAVFFDVSLVIAFAFEWFAVNRARLLIHQTSPPILGVPLLVLLGWFVALGAAYSLSAALLGRRNLPLLAASTGTLATLYDFTFDPFGLATGWWVWNRAGEYAPSVRGLNKLAGIPWSNFSGWFVLSVLVVLCFELLTRKGARDRQIFVRDAFDLRISSLFYFALCMPGLSWALRTAHWLLFLFPATLLLVLAIFVSRQLRSVRRR